MESRYGREDDYRHRFHAGNVGDVWKHCVLAALVRALADGPPLTVLDTHAGAGRYRLGPTGEWTAGIGRLDDGVPASVPEPVARYLTLAGPRRLPDRGGIYPGSPTFVLAGLRPEDRLVAVERVDEVRAELEKRCGDDPRVEVRGGDGLAVLAEVAAADGRLLAFIDPPFTRKEEWTEVAEALVAAHARRPDLHALLWYPIKKSLLRAGGLLKRLDEARVPYAALDLVVTPLEMKRHALNGSGVLLVGAPAGLVEALCAAMPALGRALCTHGRWSARVQEAF